MDGEHSLLLAYCEKIVDIFSNHWWDTKSFALRSLPLDSPTLVLMKGLLVFVVKLQNSSPKL